MSKMKKALSLALAGLMTLSLASCNGSGGTTSEASGEPTGSAATGDAVDLDMWIFLEQFIDYYNTTTEVYNKKEGVTPVNLNIELFPSTDYVTKLTTAIQAGTAPDIADVEISSYGLFTKDPDNIPFVELNDIIEEAGTDNFVMSRFENYSKNGKYYGVDCHIGACIMFYNSELLNEAGVDYTTIKTWDDYRDAGIKLKEATGKVMTSYETSDVWSIYPLISQRGGDYLSTDNEVILDSDINTETLQWHQDNIFKYGIAQTTPGGNHHAEEYFSWMNEGNAASVCMPFWYVTRFVQYMPDLDGKIKIAAMPVWDDGKECHLSAQMGGTGTSILKDSEHVDVAKAWMASCKLEYDSCITSWQLLGNDPIRLDVYDDPKMAEPNKYFDYYGDDMLNTVKTLITDLPNTNITEWFPNASSAVGQTLSYEIFENGTPVKDALKSVADELRTTIEAG